MFEPPPGALRSPSLRRQKAAFWLALLTILAVSALAFLSIQRLAALSGQVERTQSMLIETARFLSSVKDVENGGRGYFLTGDERHLRTQQAGAAGARAAAARLQTFETSGELKLRIDRLVATSERRIGQSQRLPTLRGRPAEAARTIALGTQLMDDVRVEAERIMALQSEAFRQEQQTLERQAWIAQLALALGVALCLAITPACSRSAATKSSGGGSSRRSCARSTSSSRTGSRRAPPRSSARATC